MTIIESAQNIPALKHVLSKRLVVKVINILYYRNVPRNVVMVKTGDYETLRKLEQEIRLRDPGNYLALHKLDPIKEEEIESIVKEVFNESTSI